MTAPPCLQPREVTPTGRIRASRARCPTPDIC